LAQLGKAERLLDQRRALVEVYDRELRGVPGLEPAPLVQDATYGFYTLRVARRDEIDFAEQMFRRGVAVDKSFDYALPLLKPFQTFASGTYPCAERAAHEVVNLPLYPGLTARRAQAVARCARSVVEESLAGQPGKKIAPAGDLFPARKIR
jgi:dTDP-4-amino-4,6-dideoxygalactose transaminase